MCVEKLEERYFFVNVDQQQIYSISIAVARETALQTFQYMIINMYLPCNVALKLWKKEETDECLTCGLVDTSEHYLYECALV